MTTRALLILLLAAAGSVLFGHAPAGAISNACPASNPPNTLTLVGGTPQTAKLSKAFAADLQVALANSNGCPVTTPVAGIPVTFTAPSSGASGTFSASGSNTVTVGTNAAGAANAPMFTANAVAGSYSITAGSEYGSVSFAMTNTAAGIPATITAVAPTSQSATVGSRYGQPLQVRVLDANGNPVLGASVTFSLGAATGGASAASTAGASFDGGATQAIELTDAAGLAVTPLLTANAVAGGFTATATTTGITQPASFSLVNLAAKAPTIAATGRPRQTATVDTRYRRPLQVRVLDAGGRPLQGTTVTFSLGSGTSGASGTGSAGASFVGGSAQATASTDAAGLAGSPLFTANSVAGAFTATASIAAVPEPVTFSLDNLAARPATITAARGGQRSATVGSRYGRPLQVKVRDHDGRPLQGTSITFTLGSAAAGSGGTSAGATFAGGTTQATELTDAAGLATSPPVTANQVAGRFTATATMPGIAEPASFTLRNLSGKATRITAGVGAAESTAPGALFPVRLAVTVTDANGNAVPGAVVTFSAPAHGPSGRFGAHSRTFAVRTNAAGIAVAPAFTANRAQGGYVVKATVKGLGRTAAFALVNRSGG